MNGVREVKKYPVALKERAVKMARDLEAQLGPRGGAIPRVAEQLGVNVETLRGWVRAEEGGRRVSGEVVAGSEAAVTARLAELERENRDLRRANEILKLAAAFFAKDIDLRPPK
jgi:transposase